MKEVIILISCIMGLFLVETCYSQPVFQKTVADDLLLSELIANARELEKIPEEFAKIGKNFVPKASEDMMRSMILLFESQCISEIATLLFYEHEGMQALSLMDKRNLPFAYEFRAERLAVSISKVKANLEGLRSWYHPKMRPKQEIELIDKATRLINSSLGLLDIFKRTFEKAIG